MTSMASPDQAPTFARTRAAGLAFS